MPATALMRRPPVVVPASTSATQAARLMRDEHVGALVVTDPADPQRPIGVITDRDLVTTVLADGAWNAGCDVGAICSRDLVTLPDHAGIDGAVAAMRRAGVRRLLLLRRDGSLAGLISLDDVLDALAGDLQKLATTLRSGLAHEIERDSPCDDAQPSTVNLATG